MRKSLIIDIGGYKIEIMHTAKNPKTSTSIAIGCVVKNNKYRPKFHDITEDNIVVIYDNAQIRDFSKEVSDYSEYKIDDKFDLNLLASIVSYDYNMKLESMERFYNHSIYKIKNFYN